MIQTLVLIDLVAIGLRTGLNESQAVVHACACVLYTAHATCQAEPPTEALREAGVSQIHDACERICLGQIEEGLANARK